MKRYSIYEMARERDYSDAQRERPALEPLSPEWRAALEAAGAKYALAEALFGWMR